MDNDKKIIKSPYYSIDRIGAKSDLATRGLHELGLLKDEKHFTIIYVCQFCGRLINYSSTPYIFCGDYPKTKLPNTWRAKPRKKNTLSFFKKKSTPAKSEMQGVFFLFGVAEWSEAVAGLSWSVRFSLEPSRTPRVRYITDFENRFGFGKINAPQTN